MPSSCYGVWCWGWQGDPEGQAVRWRHDQRQARWEDRLALVWVWTTGAEVVMLGLSLTHW